MYWSHCWLAVTDPEVLEPDLAGPYSNPSVKHEAGAVFLNDRLRGGTWAFVAATAAIQLALVVHLVRWLRGQPREFRRLPDRPSSLGAPPPVPLCTGLRGPSCRCRPGRCRPRP